MPLIGPGIKVTTTETPGSAGTVKGPGTAFFVGETDSGPLTTSGAIRSMAGYKALYQEERTTTGAVLFDAVETFFNLNGGQCYIQRAFESGEGTLKKAKPAAELESAGAKKAIVFEARYAGVQANKWKVKVEENAGKTESKIILLNAESEVLEETEFKKEVKEYFEGKTEITRTYVILKEGTEFAAAKTEKLKELTAKALTGGANPAPVEADYEKMPEKFAKALGPGQLCIPATSGGGPASALGEKVHKAMAESCLTTKNNRVALCDIADSSATATLITNKKTYANSIAPFMQFYSSTAVIQGLTAGTTRTVAASAVVAGLCAQVDLLGTSIRAPAGVNWSLAPVVQSFTNTFTQAQIEVLSENQINTFAERQGKPVLYGFRSALSEKEDKIFWQFSSTRERMRLVWEAEEIAEPFLFLTLDGRGQTKVNFKGAIMAALKRQWELNGVFGATAEEAFIVNVGEPINTPTTESEGQLNVELRVRLSPFANTISIIEVFSPITESVAAPTPH